MATLKDKSEFSRKAAITLIKSFEYAPSVHCSYYRCLQHMLHFIYTKPLKNKKAFNDEAKSDGGTHILAINLIKDELGKDKYDSELRNAYKFFQDKIYALKNLRIKADYDEDQIHQEDGLKAQTQADALINIFNKHLKL